MIGRSNIAIRSSRLTGVAVLALGLISTGIQSSAGAPRTFDAGRDTLQRLRNRARATFLLHEPDGPAPRAAGDAGAASTASKPGRHSPEVQANSGIGGTQSETSVAVFADHVVVGFNQFNPSSPTQRSGVAYSHDGGASFTDPGGLPTGGGTKTLFGDPSVTACGDGKFYYASLYTPDQNFSLSQLAVNVGTFTGSSLTWSNPLLAQSSANDFLDKEWLVCDRLTNTLYLTYTRFVNGNVGATTELRIEIIKSVNGGAAWTAPFVLESSTTDSIQIAYVATGPNSEVYTMWERGLDDISAAATSLELRRSFNLGVTFDPKVVVRTMIPSFFPASVGFNREDTLEIGTLAVDQSAGTFRGNVYAVWVERESASAPTRDVFVASSTNQGASWSAPVRVNDDPSGNDQVMPWLSVNADGTVEAAWYDYRNWRGMYTADFYAARSVNGGASFGPNFRVSTVPSSWFAPLTLTPNFGDYTNCASEGTGFYPAWADSRNNDIDVFVTHIPTATCGNGVPDPFEQCDDGNTADNDSCSGGCATTLCGNGTLEGAEQCDDGNVHSGDGCSQVCKTEVCGDGIIQKNNHEDCDDGNTLSGDGCSATCQIEIDKTVWIADERSRLLLESVVTGTTMTIGDPGFHELGDLAFDATGKLFGATGYNSALSIGYHGVLIDMAATGLPARGSLIGSTAVGNSLSWGVHAIDFQPATGVLFGIAVEAPPSGASRLVTLSPSTGATLSVVGTLGLYAARAMAFDDATGTLYVAGKALSTDLGNNLYTVNPTTAAKTLVGPIGFLVAGMDFAPDGSLYGVVRRKLAGTQLQFDYPDQASDPAADRGLILINKTTGAGTLLSQLGSLNQQGIRFAPAIAVDHDLDGIHDVADCAPLNAANPSPGFAAGLSFSAGPPSLFTWSAAPDARFSNVYRGTITGPLGLRPAASRFDHVCFESADAQLNGDLISTDAATPPVGAAFYYASDGEGCGEGPLGADAGHPLPNPSPCPTPP